LAPRATSAAALSRRYRTAVQCHASLQIEALHQLVVCDGERSGVLGPAKKQEEAVRAVDLATLVAGDKIAPQAIMARPQLEGCGIANALSQPRAVDDVGKEHRVLAGCGHATFWRREITRASIVARLPSSNRRGSDERGLARQMERHSQPGASEPSPRSRIDLLRRSLCGLDSTGASRGVDTADGCRQ